VDTHDPSAVVTLLAKHVGDCDSKGLQGYACEYTTKLIAKMPYSDSDGDSDGDGFCLATPQMSYVSAAFWLASHAQLGFSRGCAL
jgi:hypothetical protein